MARTKAKAHETTVQVGKFGLVGILNTVIDYTVFMAITKIFSIPLERVWVAKLISGAVAMVNSFFFNRAFVFKTGGGSTLRQALRFLATTVVGVFVIQTSLVQFFSNDFPAIGRLSFDILDQLTVPALLPGIVTEAFVIKTVAFAVATIASLVWNFVTYKFWAFREHK